MFHGEIDHPTAQGLKMLRDRIARAGIPSSKLDETLNIATWNIREFGKKPRPEGALHLIAEILWQFDLIAVTEVRDDLADLQRVLQILGPQWRAVFSDFKADRRGNRERIAFVYDKRAVAFTGLASEPDPPRKKDPKTGESIPTITWWRSPFMASFRAGHFDFILIAAHIRWGDSAEGRIPPLKTLANWIDKRQCEKHLIDKDLIVMGDFNIPDVDDPLFAAITSKGLKIPKALRGDVQTNLAREKRYDQILHYPEFTKSFTDHGGVLDFYEGDHSPLFPDETLTTAQFTYRLSDHLPLWVQLNIDVEDERLDQLLNR